MKHLEGKIVYLKPIGNRLRHSKESLKKAKIIKVARVKLSFQLEGWSMIEQLRFDPRDNILRNSIHAPVYRVYESEQDYHDYNHRLNLMKLISNKTRYTNEMQDISLDDLKKAAELLKVETNEQT